MSTSDPATPKPAEDVLSWHMHPDGDRLLGQRCESCAALHFPAVRACACGGRTLVPHLLEDEGRLYAAVRVHVTSARLPDPYVVAYVDLAEGVRVFGHLDEDAHGTLVEPGTRVGLYRGVVGRRTTGEPVFGVRLRAAEGGG